MRALIQRPQNLMQTTCPFELPSGIDASGWLVPVRRCPSPNFNPRPDGTLVDLLVIHNISLPPEQFGGAYIEDFFCNKLEPGSHPYFASIAHLQVSAHCLIRRDGEVIQFVSFDDRAWHAGASGFAERTNCNDFSVGLELEGADQIPYTEQQYDVLGHLTGLLLKRYPLLTEERLVGHSDIAPDRKTDPGPAFDWNYYRSKLSHGRREHDTG